MTTVTFAQVARICLCGVDAAISRSAVQTALGVPERVAVQLLAEATSLGFLGADGDTWSLSDRGQRLADELQEAVGSIQRTSAQHAFQPYTGFLPNGSEAIPAGGV